MSTPEKRRWQLILNELSAIEAGVIAQKPNCAFVGGDSRKLLRKLPGGTIDCVITSPPYGSAKDYRAKGQIGHGQKTDEEYLPDLSCVLHELYRVCRDGSALWIVLDTTKHSGETLLLPWEIIQRARQEGWNFNDLVIWDKGRSLPWSHVGLFRGVFEYVLLLSKGRLEHFQLERIRETDHLSAYWVKYPERYNPLGKAPSDLWHFPIPVQGSWSRNGIRHFCPFPLPMVARMIALTTRDGAVVLDPFAGTGTVPAVSSFLNRRGLGIDVNRSFARNFDKKGYDSLIASMRGEATRATSVKSSKGLESLIVKLRMLKYSRTLFGELLRPDRLGKAARDLISAFVVTKSAHKETERVRNGTLGRIAIRVMATEHADLSMLRDAISQAMRKPPLSKFGLDVSVKVISARTWRSTSYTQGLSTKRWYLYLKGAFHAYERSLATSEIRETMISGSNGLRHRVPPIISSLDLRVPLMIVG